MRLTLIAAMAASFLAACASPGATVAAPLAEQPVLDFSEAGKSDEQTAFSKSVATRYGSGRPAAEITDDLGAQGFDCQDLTASSAGPDDPLFSCTRAVVAGACADAWIVDVMRGAGELAEAVEVSGRHVYRCMGALPDVG